MEKPARYALIAIGAVVALILVVAVSVPLFLNTDSFRTKIESTLSQSLGRKVTIGKLDLSILSGGLVASSTSVADDPRFSTQPFIQADELKIGVAMMPLIFDKQLVIHSFSMQSPKVQLLRAADGTWNYSTIGTNKPAQTSETQQTFPNLSVGKVEIVNGRVTVGGGPGTAGQAERIYDQVNLSVTGFSFSKSFPFTLTAEVPGSGTISASGSAGPINQKDASATPFAGHLELKHIDPLAAGFVEPTDGISGVINGLTLDAGWTGTQMRISKLVVDTPQLTIARSNAPKQAKPANAEGQSMLNNLFVDSAQVTNGTLTLTTAGQAGKPAVYQQVNAHIQNLTPTSASPFSFSAVLPGGGSASAAGQAGPFNQTNNASTPINARLTLKHIDIGGAGFLPPDAGIAGVADTQANILSNGQTLNATGNAQIVGIKLAANGTPSPKPVQIQFALAQNEQAMAGTIQQAVITIGRAVVNLSGTYQTSGPSTALNLRVVGNGMPIDEIEAFLPALGVHLPQGSQLRGGTLTTSLNVTGTSASPAISGPVQLNNTQLAGFDLGSKLNSLAQITGGRIGHATGPGTSIRSLSMNVVEQGGSIRTDKVALDVAGVGTATGAGSVSAGGAVNYNMLLKLTGLTSGGAAPQQQANAGGTAGLVGALSGFIPSDATGGAGLGAVTGIASSAMKNGIPVAIGGTTSNPTFTPNLAGVATSIGAGAAQGLLNGTNKKSNGQQQANPLGDALGGLFGHH